MIKASSELVAPARYPDPGSRPRACRQCIEEKSRAPTGKVRRVTLLAAMQDTRRLFLVKLRNAFVLAVIALGVIAYVAICFVAMLRWAVG